MTKYRIAWLPGDGCGVDVLKAAEIVLHKISLNAGDELEISGAEVLNKKSGEKFFTVPLPRSRRAIIDAGGLIPYTRHRLLQPVGSSL